MVHNSMPIWQKTGCDSPGNSYLASITEELREVGFIVNDDSRLTVPDSLRQQGHALLERCLARASTKPLILVNPHAVVFGKNDFNSTWVRLIESLARREDLDYAVTSGTPGDMTDARRIKVVVDNMRILEVDGRAISFRPWMSER